MRYSAPPIMIIIGRGFQCYVCISLANEANVCISLAKKANALPLPLLPRPSPLQATPNANVLLVYFEAKDYI